MSTDQKDRSQSVDGGKSTRTWKRIVPLFVVLLLPAALILSSIALGFLNVIDGAQATALILFAVALRMGRLFVMQFYSPQQIVQIQNGNWIVEGLRLTGLMAAGMIWFFVPYLGWRLKWFVKDDVILFGALGLALTLAFGLIVPRIIRRYRIS